MKSRDVDLIPSILVVRIYKGNDFPQMDAKDVVRKKKKEYVDPYCFVRFAGQEEKTSTKDNNYDPEWNQEMRFTTYVSLKLLSCAFLFFT